ncbi:hypothetical protein E4U17_002690 [Claviceps sp. LM77 group G4]|nr:hypothetical protein E4U17_002690 [Claviceps sp. LM77 group G4]
MKERSPARHRLLLAALRAVAVLWLWLFCAPPLYLLEGNYRETAAKFQKEWHVKEPHRDLPFAPHVQGRALVSVVNNGLLYHGLKREFALKKLSSNATGAELDALRMGIFGPLTPPAESKSEEAPPDGKIVSEGDVEALRKRYQSQGSDESPAKRPHLGHGHADAHANVNPNSSTNSNTNADAIENVNENTSVPASIPASASVSASAATAGFDAAIPADTGTGTATQTSTNNKNDNDEPVTTRSLAGNLFDNEKAVRSQELQKIYTSDVTGAHTPASHTPASNLATELTLMDIDDMPNHPSRPHSLDESSLQESNSNQAYPSPMEIEPLPPLIRTDGPEQGTQVEQVEELLPDTKFIRLMDGGGGGGGGGDGSLAEAMASPSSSASAEHAPVLLQCQWSPRDPSVLAAAGTDALARIWTISGTALSGDQVLSSRAHTLLDPDTPRTTTVTAMSWTSDGAAIAVATDSGSVACVHVYSADGVLLQSMEVSEPPVIKLSWNPSNTFLLAISPEKGGALITAYSSRTGAAITHYLPGHDVASPPLDATWTNDAEFLVAGGDLLLHLSRSDTSITQSRKFETNQGDCFNHVLFDWRTSLAATSSDRGTLDLWDESGQRRTIRAHRGPITTMAWQPMSPTQPVSDDERLIATGGEDCAILIWNVRKPESSAKCYLTMDSPIVQLAFTPDGAFIAGATSRQVLIWKVDDHTVPRASWNRPPHPGWLSPKGSSEMEEEDEHCLCWDVSGQKLAYGSNSRLAVITFSR